MEISIPELKQLLELADKDAKSEVTPCHDFDWDDLLPDGWRFRTRIGRNAMTIINAAQQVVVEAEDKQDCIAQALRHYDQYLRSVKGNANTESRPQFPVPYPGVTVEYERDPLGE